MYTAMTAPKPCITKLTPIQVHHEIEVTTLFCLEEPEAAYYLLMNELETAALDGKLAIAVI
jgi:hypothetical protein